MTVRDFFEKTYGGSHITIKGYCEEERYDYYLLPVDEEVDFSGNNPRHYKPMCLEREEWFPEIENRKIKYWRVGKGERDQVEIYIILEESSDEEEIEEMMTNGDKIRQMSDDELVKILMCPYDTAGDPVNIMPCVKDRGTQELVTPEECNKCMKDWLSREVKEK